MNNIDNWTEISKLAIVYHKTSTIVFNGIKYRKAFIADGNNKDSIFTAMNWAREYLKDSIVYTDNCGFRMQIAQAPGNSSQSGKLSFWMCIITKKDIEPFAVGINSELLCAVIIQSNLSKGQIIGDELMFIKKSGQLGVIHEKMKEYGEFCQAIAFKKNVKLNKTKNWEIGYKYITLNTSDVMLGKFQFPIIFDDSNYKTIKFNLDFNRKPCVIYSWVPLYVQPEKETLFESLVCDGIETYEYKFSCPARQKAEKVFNEDDNYSINFANAILAIEQRNIEELDIYHNLKYILQGIMILYPLRPKDSIKLLKSLKDKLKNEEDFYEYTLQYNGELISFNHSVDLVDKIINLTEMREIKIETI